MSSFTLRAEKIAKAIISECHISEAFKPENSPKHLRKFMGLWDTGATGTTITQRVVDELGLKATGMAQVHHANGESTTETYLVNVGLPNKVLFTGVRVTKCILKGFDVLIGMDIIASGDFAITNKDGKTIFSFRCPSVGTIDFVNEARLKQTLDSASPKSQIFTQPRNQICRCGSGKKYKYCCGMSTK